MILHCDLGLCSYRVKNYEEAIKEFKISSQKGREDADLYNNMGTSYMHLGVFDEAESSFRKAMALDALNHDSSYNLGTMKLNLGEIAASLEVFSEAKRRMLAKGTPTYLVDLRIKQAESLEN